MASLLQPELITKLQGKLRYLDSRDDEQERGITMESSSISLLYKHAFAKEGGGKTKAAAAETKSTTTTTKSTTTTTTTTTTTITSAEKNPKKLPSKKKSKKRQSSKGSSNNNTKASKGDSSSNSNLAKKTDLGKRGNDGIYFINLIDSPGHIDFSSEVSTAVRFSDGGMVLVDVVEGVCTQTRTVLEQAWSERLACCLVLNKIDKLITDLRYEPYEAYEHLVRIIEQVNALASSFANAELAEQERDSLDYDKMKPMVFSPELGNVAFASAYDTWGFTLQDMADFYALRLGIRRSILMRTLWGHCFWSKKKRQPMRRPPKGSSGEVMAVEFMLRPIWDVYALEESKSKEAMEQYIEDFAIKVPPRELVGRPWREKVRAILGRWLPVGKSVLAMAVDLLPDPRNSQASKISRIWNNSSGGGGGSGSGSGGGGSGSSSSSREEPMSASASEHKRASVSDFEGVRAAAVSCDSDSDHVLVYVAKMLDVGEQALAEANQGEAGGPNKASSIRRTAYVKGRLNKAPQVVGKDGKEQHTGRDSTTQLEAEEEDTQKSTSKLAQQPQTSLIPRGRFLAFARVFAGTIDTKKQGQKLFLLKPGYDPSRSPEQNSRFLAEIPTSRLGLFLIMANSFHKLPRVPAGCILGISGLDELLVGACTLSVSANIPTLSPMLQSTAPIVKVAVNPQRYADMRRLLDGLKLLKQADPNVQVGVESDGSHVLMTTGELHLERCVTDLNTRFAQGIDFKVSKPLVSFKETILAQRNRKARGDDQQAEERETKSSKLVSLAQNLNKVKALEDSESLEDRWKAQQEKKRLRQKKRQTHVSVSSSDKSFSIKVRALPMPLGITRALQRHRGQLVDSLSSSSSSSEASAATSSSSSPQIDLGLGGTVRVAKEVIQKAVDAAAKEEKELLAAAPNSQQPQPQQADDAKLAADAYAKEQKAFWKDFSVESVMGLGPFKVGANLLVDNTAADTNIDSNTDDASGSGPGAAPPAKGGVSSLAALPSQLLNGIVNAFQMVTEKGALCEEPMTGVAMSIESVRLDNKAEDPANKLKHGGLYGQIIQASREAFRRAIEVREQRLVEPMYLVELQCNEQVLRRLYAVIGKRRGRIISEDLREGTQIFVVKCYLPVEQSFGFATSLRQRTSGMASPQLVFSHWEVIQEDPFFVPITDEEKEEFGSNAVMKANLARTLVDKVRKRKGLPVEELIVQHAEKQRTLARKK